MAGKKRAGNHQGHIRQLPSGKWHVEVMINGRREYITAPTKKELQLELAKRLVARNQGVNYDKNTTYEEYLQGWLERKKKTVRRNTYNSYESLIRSHVIPALGRYKLHQLTAARIQAFYDHSSAGKRTLELCHCVIHNSLEQAYRQELIEKNYADLVDAPRSERHEMKYWDESQISAFLVTARGSRFEHAFALAFATGMRIGEILGLAWDDVDFAKRTIYIRRSLRNNAKQDDPDKFDPPKTESGYRKLRLGAGMMDRLKDQMDRQDTWRRAAGDEWRHTGLVFTTTLGTHITGTNYRREFVKITEAAGLPQIRPYDARHSFVSLMRKQGYSLRVVSKYVGHNNESVTRNVYSHVFPDELHEVGEELDQFITLTPFDMSQDKN